MNGEFEPDKLKTISLAAENFCEWVLAVIYHQKLLQNVDHMNAWIKDTNIKIKETEQQLMQFEIEKQSVRSKKTALTAL